MRSSMTGIILAAMLAAPATVIAQGAAKPSAAGDAAPVKAPAVETAPAKAEDNVRITLQTVPPRRALVKWGKKTLGVIPVPKPLIVVRPRDSGPMDLVIRVTGYLPVHTRAYTFSDNRLAVRLTPVEEKYKLFGYREELPPEGEADAGAAPDPSAPAPVPAQPAQTPPQATTPP